MSWLTPDVVQSICDYMNEHQADSVVEIVRRNGIPDAEEATLVELTLEDGVYDVGGTRVRVPWSMPLTHRAQIREELVQLAML